MTLVTRLASAAFAAALTTGLMPLATAPAAAQSSLSISYRDYDRSSYHYDRGYRYDRDRRYNRDRRNWHRDDRRHYYRAPRRCWTELRWDRWRGERVRVRICR